MPGSHSPLSIPVSPFKTVVVQPFEHGNEGELIEIAKDISSEAELWITGNNDAAGIGALGIALYIITESPEYQVFCVLFKDHSLDEAAREKIFTSTPYFSSITLRSPNMAMSSSVDLFTVVQMSRKCLF